MNKYFNINYEFDPAEVHCRIDKQLHWGEGADYICVADGVILNIANRDPEYLRVVNGGMFSICDSSYVPLYLRWIYGKRYGQYCGSEIFRDIVSEGKYRMIFLGAQQKVLDALKENLIKVNPAVGEMSFVELPFKDVDGFDYKAIAKTVEKDGADIIWVALGAPKQERFMNRLKPYLHRGVMIAVGAAFKFYSGVDENRAPSWMVRSHLEWVYRIFSEPRKQIRRCAGILTSLPSLLIGEWRRKRRGNGTSAL